MEEHYCLVIHRVGTTVAYLRNDLINDIWAKKLSHTKVVNYVANAPWILKTHPVGSNSAKLEQVN